MNTKITSLRPGVYTSYTLSSQGGTGSGGGVGGLVAVGIPGEQPVEVTRVAQLETAFPGEENQRLRQMATLLLKEGVSSLWCVAVNGRSEEYTAAFTTLSALSGIEAICCDSGDLSVAQSLQRVVVAASLVRREQLGVLAVADPEEALALSTALNCERTIVCCGSGLVGEISSPTLLAAAFTGHLLGVGDPTTQLNGAALSSLEGLTEALTEEQVEILLAGGAIPFEWVGGQVECIRGVTTRTTTDGLPDATYRSINTVRIIDRVLAGLRQALTTQLIGNRGGAQTRESLLTCALVELAAYQEEGWLESYQTPLAYPHEEDGGICVLEVAFVVAQTVGQVLVSAQIQV